MIAPLIGVPTSLPAMSNSFTDFTTTSMGPVFETMHEAKPVL